MRIKKVKDSYLKKELRRLTHNKKLVRVLKTIDKLTKFRSVDMKKEKGQFRLPKDSGADHKVYLLDPNIGIMTK